VRRTGEFSIGFIASTSRAESVAVATSTMNQVRARDLLLVSLARPAPPDSAREVAEARVPVEAVLMLPVQNHGWQIEDEGDGNDGNTRHMRFRLKTKTLSVSADLDIAIGRPPKDSDAMALVKAVYEFHLACDDYNDYAWGQRLGRALFDQCYETTKVSLEASGGVPYNAQSSEHRSSYKN
jgi:hypothetical protein